MKRSHRRSHLIIWLILTPLLLAVIKFAVSERPADPVNEALPAALLEEAN